MTTITELPLNIIRFDTHQDLYYSDDTILNQKIKVTASFTVDKEKGCKLIIKTTINFLRHEDLQELLGFLSEQEFVLQSESKEKDIEDLTHLFREDFIKIEKIIQEKKHVIIENMPDFPALAMNTILSMEIEGFYK
ncbi:hypothetical protein [Pedobacter mucosus]|uniref:hypothetical protein n=1 Tax=Pedobacter mucosus TaxID=2895286 RepID=UPI001EE41EEA|nr:hypothetical protein [Pedobacter mucosus]UKT65618.1 hypothetical protein LOK61_07460 [Pedobacter mucosus]